MKYWIFLALLGILILPAAVHATDFNNTGFEQGYLTSNSPLTGWCPFYDSWPNDTSQINSTLAYAGTRSNYGGGIMQLLTNTGCVGGGYINVTVTMRVFVNSTDPLNTTSISIGGVSGFSGGYPNCNPVGKQTYATKSDLVYDTWQEVNLTGTFQNCVQSADPILNKGVYVWIDTPQFTKLYIDEVHGVSQTNTSPVGNWGINNNLTTPQTGIGEALGNITGASGYGQLIGLLFTPFFWATLFMFALAAFIAIKVKNNAGTVFIAVCILMMIVYAVLGIYPYWILIVMALLIGLYFYKSSTSGK